MPKFETSETVKTRVGLVGDRVCVTFGAEDSVEANLFEDLGPKCVASLGPAGFQSGGQVVDL